MKIRRIVTVFLMMAVMMLYGVVSLAGTTIFHRKYIDSNTWTFVTSGYTDMQTNCVGVGLDQILCTDGSYTNYKKVQAQIRLEVAEGEVVLVTTRLNGSQVAGVHAGNDIELGRDIPRSNYLNFYAMGNDARYDCLISGAYSTY